LNELNPHQPHQPHRPDRRCLKVRHKLSEEEDIPIDAPNVECHQMINDQRHSPVVRQAQRPFEVVESMSAPQGGASSSEAFDLNALGLGLRHLVEPQLEHTVLKRGLNLVGVQIPAQCEAAAAPLWELACQRMFACGDARSWARFASRLAPTKTSWLFPCRSWPASECSPAVMPVHRHDSPAGWLLQRQAAASLWELACQRLLACGDAHSQARFASRLAPTKTSCSVPVGAGLAANARLR